MTPLSLLAGMTVAYIANNLNPDQTNWGSYCLLPGEKSTLKCTEYIRDQFEVRICAICA